MTTCPGLNMGIDPCGEPAVEDSRYCARHTEARDRLLALAAAVDALPKPKEQA